MQQRIRRRNPAEKDKTILTAARRLFARQGIEATSMADVAKAAHVAVGSIYVRYPSKDHLVDAVTEDFAQLFIEAMDRAAERVQSRRTPEGLPRFVAQELFHTAEENKDAFRVLLNGQTKEDGAHGVIAEIARHLENGQKQGLFRKMNTKIAAVAAYGMVGGTMRAWMADKNANTSPYVKELAAALEGMAVKR